MASNHPDRDHADDATHPDRRSLELCHELMRNERLTRIEANFKVLYKYV